jgi:hypothetical protein
MIRGVQIFIGVLGLPAATFRTVFGVQSTDRQILFQWNGITTVWREGVVGRGYVYIVQVLFAK